MSPKILTDSFVISLFLQVETLPYRHEILRVGSWNLESPPGNFAEPSASGNTNSSSFWVTSVFWDFFLMSPNFPTLQKTNNQNIFLPSPTSRDQSITNKKLS